MARTAAAASRIRRRPRDGRLLCKVPLLKRSGPTTKPVPSADRATVAGRFERRNVDSIVQDEPTWSVVRTRQGMCGREPESVARTSATLLAAIAPGRPRRRPSSHRSPFIRMTSSDLNDRFCTERPQVLEIGGGEASTFQRASKGLTGAGTGWRARTWYREFGLISARLTAPRGTETGPKRRLSPQARPFVTELQTGEAWQPHAGRFDSCAAPLKSVSVETLACGSR